MRLLSVFLFFLSLNIWAQTVYKTPSGAKYHLEQCRMVKNVSTAISVNQAAEQGLTPCKICRPPYSGTLGLVSKPKKVPGTSSGTQCLGITQKGTRCKRNTKIGNSYCFQHLP
ncbi:hypothetical protein [Chryseobacterium koreense]|uniref:hypothetical protein n=1 Tax=Chryseobacterium koreense TaxID=232216 RepID=UPI00065AC8E2|nr:hypothetical protein [Chryseobacterium koreense]MBB5332715.1 hypothetical protein [Chryseobacterium koreense]